MEDVINNTSVDDIRSSLYHIDPGSPATIRDDLEYLRRSLKYEIENRNRITVIKMLKAKIRNIERRV